MNLDEILNILAKGEITPQTAKKFIQLYSIVEIDKLSCSLSHLVSCNFIAFFSSFLKADWF